MRVLALMTEAFGALGGIQKFNRDWVTALAELDSIEQIEILVRRQSPVNGLPERVTQHCPRLGKPGYVAAALSKAKDLGPDDVILCGHIHLMPLAFLVANMTGAKIWLQLHGVEAWSKPGPLIRRALTSTGLISVVSRFTRSRFLSWSTISPHRVKVLPIAVSENFNPGNAPVDLKARMELTGKRVLLTVGRMASNEAYKGQDRVIYALPRILEREPDTVYLVVGDGDDRPRLEALTKSLTVEQHVRFLGSVEGSDLVSLYRIADLFVMPSEGEGFGIVFLEAMACGCRALGLNSGGSIDALSGSQLGYTCDADELAEAIVDILGSPRGSAEPGSSRFSRRAFDACVADMTKVLTGLAS